MKEKKQINNVKPLYTTVLTDYIDKLEKCAAIVDDITNGVVSRKHLGLIISSIKKAKAKHPFFVNKVTRIGIEYCIEALHKSRSLNDMREKDGSDTYADDIIEEESLEAKERYLNGDMEGFLEETADIIAIYIRTMEMAEEKKKLEQNKGTSLTNEKT